jgi:geranyl-CoA carboxylase beta subunit
MPAIVSRIDVRSAGFAANAARMADRLAEVRQLERQVVDESASRREKFEQRAERSIRLET